MKIRRIDHVGINVDDLPAAKEFFLEFGFEMMGEGEVEGDWVGRIIGLPDVKSTIVMMRTPGGETNIELVKFHRPLDEAGVQQPSPANTLGIRHLSFAVEDVDGLVARLQKKGATLMGEIVNYENVYRLCYLRGPEGIILELAEELE